MTVFYRTTECVSAGHPDKVADFIADCVLDAHLFVDPKAKVACEVLVKDDIVVLGGEISFVPKRQKPDLAQIVNEAAGKLGYNVPALKFSAGAIKVMNLVTQQSPEINQAVVAGGDENLGAGDQGIMWGYATNETPNFMPLGMFLARGIMNAMRPLEWDVLFADCKTQVTIEYDSETQKPLRVTHVVVSCLHTPDKSLEEVQMVMRQRLVPYITNLPDDLVVLFDNPDIKYILNHAGAWTFGGPAADTGVTGRKIVVDAYGSECEVGGGAFSGKDGTKVDRSGAYAARFIAKNIVAAGLASKCKVQLGYVIGQAEPVSFNIDLMGTGAEGVDPRILETRIRELLPLTPSSFIKRFDLSTPRFAMTALYGHFGIDAYPWENTKELAHRLRFFERLSP